MKENNRIDELKAYQILDTDSHEDLDELVQLVSLLFNSPSATISFFDENREWFKAKNNIVIDQVSIEDSISSGLIENSSDILIVEDIHQNSKFKNNPLLNKSLNFKFYAAVPIKTLSGNVIGALSVMHNDTLNIKKNQKKALMLFAKKVTDFLEIRKKKLEKKYESEVTVERFTKLTDYVPGGIFQLRMTSEGKLNFEFLSQGMEKIHPSVKIKDWLKAPELGFSIIHPDDLAGFQNQLMISFKNLSPLKIEYRAKDKDFYKWHMMDANPEKMIDGSVVWYGSFQDINDRINYEETMKQMAFDISHVLRKPVSNLLGLNNLIETEKDISKEALLEYVKYIKTVSLELEDFTQKLSDVYQRKNKLITEKK